MKNKKGDLAFFYSVLMALMSRRIRVLLTQSPVESSKSVIARGDAAESASYVKFIFMHVASFVLLSFLVFLFFSFDPYATQSSSDLSRISTWSALFFQ